MKFLNLRSTKLITLNKLTACLLIVLLSGLITSALAAQTDNKKQQQKEAVNSFNYVLGTQAIGGHYQFSIDNALVEQARQVKNLGSNLLKISLGKGTAKRYGFQEKALKAKSALAMLKSTPALKHVFDMNFKYYQAWIHSYTKGKWRDGVTKKEADDYYKEMYELAEYFLTKYSGTGKIFMLGNWEGDWLLHKKMDRNSTPSDKAIQGMTDWLNIRQKAIDDAKKNVKHQDVELYHYLEVNLVNKAMDGKKSVAHSVLPNTNVDLVSYSSYEAINGSKKPNIDAIRKPLTKAMNYLEGQLKPKAGIPFKRRVFIGEYGYKANKNKPETVKSQYIKSKHVMQVAIELDLPFALIWQMYNNEYSDDGISKEMSLIDESDDKRLLFYLHKVYLNKMRYFVAQSYKKTGKVPSQEAFKQQAIKVLKNISYKQSQTNKVKLEKPKTASKTQVVAPKAAAKKGTKKKGKKNKPVSGPSIDKPFNNGLGYKSAKTKPDFDFSATAKSFNNVNVLVVMSDQHKKSASGAYGHKVIKTPTLDALAKDGTLFTNAYTPAPVCAPARAAMQTGMYPYANGAVYHKAPKLNEKGKEKKVGSGEFRETGYHEHIMSLAQMFKSKGYITAAPGKMHVHGELQTEVDDKYPQGNDMGFDETSLRYYSHFPGKHYEDVVGSDTYNRYKQTGPYKKLGGSQDLNADHKPSLVKVDEENFDMLVANTAVDFINRRGKDKQNFFLHVGFEKPHLPLTTLQKYYDMYDVDDFELPDTVNDWYEKGRYPWLQDWVHNATPQKNKNKAIRIMAAYAACITEMDEMFGRLIKALKQNGQYENTIIVYSTDHGEHMFEHGLRGKHNMYDAAINIPFIVSYPKALPKGQVNDSVVSLIDIMPTLAELVGANVSDEVQGLSLVDTIKTDKVIEDRAVFTEYRQGGYKAFSDADYLPSRMMRKGKYKFVYTHGIIHQLYDIASDPDELNNLILDPAYTELAKQYAFETLAQWRFEKYYPITLKVKGNKLSWTELSQAKGYNLFYSPTNTPAKASLLQQDIKKTTVKVDKKGYYWLLADFNLTRTTKRLGDTPVWLKNHTYRLPISDPILIK